MSTRLYWIDGPWKGKLALAARPSGNDWLEDELAKWKLEGINTILSLLTADEEDDLGLRDEAQQVKAQGMGFVSLPIIDRGVPESSAMARAVLEKLDRALSAGQNVVVHCRQGIGRSGLMAAGLLVLKGATPEDAVRKLSAARGVAIPETAEQRHWIDRYATILTGAK